MDLEQAARALQKSGKADKIKSVADSEDARRLGAMLDEKAIEKAAVTGDAAALRDIFRRVMETDEGKRIAKTLDELMK